MKVIVQITPRGDMSGKRPLTESIKVDIEDLPEYGFSERDINRLVEFEVNDIRCTKNGAKLKAFPVRGV